MNTLLENHTVQSAAVARPVGEFKRRWVQGVEYFHARTADGGDLFLTRYGLPFARQLHPENWYSAEWFVRHRRRLRGTSTIYQSTTRPVDGHSLDLIVRFSRVGELVPMDTPSNQLILTAEFNSPFEEIARLMQLRLARLGKDRRRIHTKRPLAIYMPPERLEVWQTGRSRDKMVAKQAAHGGAELDIRRQYLVLYGWIDGLDAEDAVEELNLATAERTEFLRETTEAVVRDLAEAGFRVLDMKPAHIIVRVGPDGHLLRRKDGRLVYALVDYELLERT
jgi:hypothetical protein